MICLHILDLNTVALKAIAIVVCLIFIFLTIEKFHELTNQYRYHKTKQLAEAGYHEEALAGYQKLKDLLYNDSWYKEKLFFSNQYLDLGDCYYALNLFA